MTQLNLQPETDFFRLITLLEDGQEDGFLLIRNGQPVAALTPPQQKVSFGIPNQPQETKAPRVPGVGRDMIHLPPDFYELDKEMDREIEAMFEEAVSGQESWK